MSTLKSGLAGKPALTASIEILRSGGCSASPACSVSAGSAAGRWSSVARNSSAVPVGAAPGVESLEGDGEGRDCFMAANLASNAAILRSVDLGNQGMKGNHGYQLERSSRAGATDRLRVCHSLSFEQTDGRWSDGFGSPVMVTSSTRRRPNMSSFVKSLVSSGGERLVSPGCRISEACPYLF